MVLEGSQLYRAIASGAQQVIKQKDHLNSINVFPVADGDTGSNLTSTMQTLLLYMEESQDVAVVMQTAATGAVKGARGNSGLIFAQFFVSVSRDLKSAFTMSISDFSSCIGKAIDELYQSVLNPREGTVLTVMRSWAVSLKEHQNKFNKTADFLKLTLEDTHRMLLCTPEFLPVLKQNGVVDSGAQGFFHFLEGFCGSFEPEANWQYKTEIIPKNIQFDSKSIEASAEASAHENSQYRYCCEAFLSNLKKDNPKELRQILSQWGDSTMVVGDSTAMRVHVHSSRADKVFEILRMYGELSDIKIDNMQIQTSAKANPRASVAIVTDSIADLPKEYIDEHQIFVVPMQIELDGELHLDRITITEDEFSKINGSLKTQPKSSLPSSHAVESLFDFLTAHYSGVLVLAVSSQLSGTSAMFQQLATKKSTEDCPIKVIDTKKNSGAQGMLVTLASQKAEAGKPLEEIYSEIQNLIDDTKILVAMNDTCYLARSGRVTHKAGFLMKLLGLKPILTLSPDGRGITYSGALRQKTVMKKIINQLKKEQKKYDILCFNIVHASVPETAAEFAELVRKTVGKTETYITNLSPILQAYAGEKTVAVSYIRQRKELS